MAKNPIKKGDIMEIYVDGASRSNPGPASCAFIFVKKNEGILHQKYEYIGHKTNNMAEYAAIIEALKEAEKFTRWDIKVYSDSELVIKQLNRQYRIKAKHLSKLCDKVYNLCGKFESVEFFHVRRSHHYIKKCDSLCNKCLDEM